LQARQRCHVLVGCVKLREHLFCVFDQALAGLARAVLPADPRLVRRDREVRDVDVGWFTAPAGIFRAGDDMDRTIRFPVPAYVVETATERILIDTGLNPAAIADPASYYNRPDIFASSALEQEQNVAEQLDVGTLTKVVLTHLHWDHVGGLALIPASVPVVVQRTEWQAGHDDAAMQRNFFLSRDYADDR